VHHVLGDGRNVGVFCHSFLGDWNSVNENLKNLQTNEIGQTIIQGCEKGGPHQEIKGFF